MLDRPLTFMAVHAHPDDEATGTGGVLARYSAQGIQTVLVTCTDGGCGDGPDGVKPGEPGHDVAAVVEMRRKELAASCAVLGVTHLELLGYADSGMEGWPQNHAPGAFWGTSVDDGAARLVQLIDRYQPDVIVTYDEFGFYGHPDHIQAHRITMAAIKASGTTAKVYWTTAPRSWMESMGELMRELGEEVPEPDASQSGELDAGFPDIGLPDDQITTWVDIQDVIDQKFDSLAAHASQGDSTFFLRMGRERFAQFMGVETFVRVDPHEPVGGREDDLFAGLRPAPATDQS